MSGHAQKFGGYFPQIFVVKFEKMKLVRKTPKLAKSVTISYIHLFLVVDNPQKLVPFLTVWGIAWLGNCRRKCPARFKPGCPAVKMTNENKIHQKIRSKVLNRASTAFL
jgi:hypothetical protein